MLTSKELSNNNPIIKQTASLPHYLSINLDKWRNKTLKKKRTAR